MNNQTLVIYDFKVLYEILSEIENYLNFNLINDKEYFSVRYQYKPLMFWVWISTFFIAFGGALTFIRKK